MIFIIFDLEATCWRGHPPGGANEIIEIGAYKIDRNGMILDEFNIFIKPTVNPKLSKFCQKLTSIKQNDVDRASHFPTAIEEFKEWIDVHNIDYRLCSWGKFDVQLFRNDCQLHSLEENWLEAYLDVKGQYTTNNQDHKLTGLKNTLKREGMEFTGIHHRAIADAHNLSKIFIKYVDEWLY